MHESTGADARRPSGAENDAGHPTTVWDGRVRLRDASLASLVLRFGGSLLRRGPEGEGVRVHVLAPVERAGEGDLAPVLAPRYVPAALSAAARGAVLLVDAPLATDARLGGESARVWVHPRALSALCDLLEEACDAPELSAVVGKGSRVGPNVTLGPRVVVGRRVVIGAGCVIGSPGFGWVDSAEGARAVPQLGGVVIEDDVHIGPLSTVDAGTLAPTRIRKGAKLDAHVHVGHNVDIGEHTIVAAQSGFAGSVVVGRGVRIGGQVGIADHVRIGDGARIAAKSGVIGDVPAGSVVAGYPAVPRARWLRALAWLHRASESPRGGRSR
jgi:UDP-3-O-[3-hydroxymyristoyl] glucosamine N-acyltransferase